MDDIVIEKQDLPTPFNRDLSKVLRNLDRSTERGFVGAANHPLTAAFLHVGMTLIRNELGPGAIRRPAVPGEEGSVERRALDFLSQREVVKQMRRIEKPFERNDSASGALRRRWRSHSHYIADLLRFGLWAEQYGTEYTLMRQERERWLMDPRHDLAEAVHSTAAWELSLLTKLPIFRLHLLAISTAEGDEVIREAIAGNYREVLSDWTGTYERAFLARGLRPRPGASFAKLADIVAAMAEGMAMRQLGDARSPVWTSKDCSLFGEGAIWLLLGCMQPAEEDDQRTAEDRVREMAGPRTLHAAE